ncbi:MAG: peptidylprolyl isomerase [Desulfobulbaceae bacterium]|nr:peptidylprolyl isomerase [Desulfobulbaceae bacterium]
MIIMETSMGTIKIELFDKEAPLSVENFRNYVRQGFYNGLIFHRIIPKFMIQGGGFEPGMKRRTPTQPPVANEATNGLKNKRGTLSMARTGRIHSATSQFFLNVVDNISLDNRGTLPHQFGYAVFAKVVEGMEVADRIVASPATTVSSGAGQFKNVPKQDVVIIKVYEEDVNE